MTVHRGIFGDDSNFDDRFISSYEQMARTVELLKNLGLKVVLTSGSFDLIHMGHAEYLERAKQFGDLLVVGVDSDDKIRQRKGNDRPVVPQMERLRMLSHLRHVDLVVVKPIETERWGLIKAVKPDVLVATAETYTPEQIAELERGLCGKVEVLPRMSTTSTSARIREFQINLIDRVGSDLSDRLPGILRSLLNEAIGRGNSE